ncbi:MAG: ATP synthase F1 subunit epsilon [Phocaeicola sp.]|uniref:ATP synthase F1 subunit epsilon n=1 Tax=Phocaeicola sp. TaxID=2773926 RepID=UPI0023BCC8DE|nr:ATP synthase F1 subunit epsilon [Phocaeicola sp.]MDE5676623.1 ATP synthase F1 subunit epsilon [Phocaeicola sp.]MDE6181433.1 ATP synthase F1 subunit epsilon [Phocaeicola sp.]
MEHHEGFHLIVVSPESTLFDGKAEIVTLPGKQGSFTVLYDHAPLISSLVKGKIRYVDDEQEHTIGISSGFVEVRDNIVSVCVEI